MCGVVNSTTPVVKLNTFYCLLCPSGISCVELKLAGFSVSTNKMSPFHFACCFIFIIYSANSFLVPGGKVSVKSNVGEIVGFSTVMNINGSQKGLRHFLGIPYAEPPTGVRRFRKPVSRASFTTPFDASDYGPACLQQTYPEVFKNFTFTEDCLYLNVFVPENLPSDNHLHPTMVWIHGGGFVTGLSSIYDVGSFSLGGNNVVVTINYRLNVWGFLSTDDPITKGNLGLFDQQMAIKWVHDNIQSFGGDPNRITLFGESAGGASVVYHSLYPGNKGLFQRGIAQSGGFSSPWAFAEPEKAKNQTRHFAKLVGCSQMDDVLLVSCLQSMPTSNITNVIETMVNEGEADWPPTIDGEFVVHSPKELLTGPFPSNEIEEMFLGVDLMMSVNSREGLVMFEPTEESQNLDMNSTYIHQTLIPYLENLYENEPLSNLVMEAIKLEYTEWEELDNIKEQFYRLTDLITDKWYHVPAAQTAQRHAMNSTRTTFVFELSAAPPYHILPIYEDIDGPTVVNHGDDISFLFNIGLGDGSYLADKYNTNFTDKQRRIGQAMTTMWSNFATSG